VVLEVDPRDVHADDLRYLAALADTGRLVAAARALGVDHATVSRRLRALEKALGARLVGRGHDGWDLTEAGRAVVEHARAVQAAVERATLAAAGARADAIVGTVRITAADGFGTRFAVPALARVRAKHADLSVELVTGARQLGLRDSSFDLALTVGALPSTRLFTERLCDYDFAFYASRAYLDEHGDPASLHELRSHRLVFFVDSLQRVRELDLNTYLPDATVGFSSTNIFALVEAARRGAGVALLPKFMAQTAPDLRRIAAETPPARVVVTLAVRKDAMTRRDVQVVREALHQEVRNRQQELTWN
jgi:DNA-binding transcriptional LysR family regulator